MNSHSSDNCSPSIRSEVYSENEQMPRESEVMKKRKSLNEEKWKRNSSKSKRARGEEYISVRGKVVKARTTGKNCKCKSKCFEKVDPETRGIILTNFNSIGNKKEQDEYLCGMITCNEIKRRRIKTGTGKPCNVSNAYAIRIGTTKLKVCKNAFCAFHGISRKRVEILASHIGITKSLSAPTDERGKHHNRPNSISQEILDQIVTHIKKFPRQTSHYSRQKNLNRYYLSPELNIRKLYELYLNTYEPEVNNNMKTSQEEQQNTLSIKPVVSYDFFYRYFKSNFKNYSFGHPRSDTCQTCDTLENEIKNKELTEDQKHELKTKKELHLNKCQVFYDDLKMKHNLARNDPTVDALCFDFQQNAPLPKTPAGDAFYLR